MYRPGPAETSTNRPGVAHQVQGTDRSILLSSPERTRHAVLSQDVGSYEHPAPSGPRSSQAADRKALRAAAGQRMKAPRTAPTLAAPDDRWLQNHSPVTTVSV